MSSPVDLVTLEEARYLALVAQRLEPLPGEVLPPKGSKAHLLAVIRQSGVVQLDSISVVSRAHETALWSRIGSYTPAKLSALHYPDTQLVEYWAHAASLLPVEFLPYLRRRMLRYRDPRVSRWARWATDHAALLDDVRETVAARGPLTTRAFERPPEIERRPWDWFGGKPAKEALDYLWTSGELVIQRRIGFERVYDLADRVFPGFSTAPLPEPDAEAAFFTGRALAALGIGSVPWIADYFGDAGSRYVPIPAVQETLEALEQAGQAHRVALQDHPTPVWLDAAIVPALEAFRSSSARPRARTLLSPFDNLLWRRDRALALFGFDYKLESYVPEPKRIYGYYTLPILIDGRLIGRLDARFRRKQGLLSVQALHLEPGIRPTLALASTILAILRAFTRFLGGTTIEVLACYPATLHPHILKRLG